MLVMCEQRGKCHIHVQDTVTELRGNRGKLERGDVNSRKQLTYVLFRSLWGGRWTDTSRRERHPRNGELGTGRGSQGRWHFSSRALVIPTETSTAAQLSFPWNFWGNIRVCCCHIQQCAHKHTTPGQWWSDV